MLSLPNPRTREELDAYLASTGAELGPVHLDGVGAVPLRPEDAALPELAMTLQCLLEAAP